MLYAPRYTDPASPDIVTGFMFIHPFAYDEIRSALEKKSGKKSAKVRVNLQGDGDRGNSWLIEQYTNTGTENKGDSYQTDQAAANSITFWLKKGKITKYSLDAVNDAYDFTLKPRSFDFGSKSARFNKAPIPLNDIFAMSDLYNQGKIGEMYVYADQYLWPNYYRYADVGQSGVSVL